MQDSKPEETEVDFDVEVDVADQAAPPSPAPETTQGRGGPERAVPPAPRSR